MPLENIPTGRAKFILGVDENMTYPGRIPVAEILQSSKNLSDVSSATTALSNLNGIPFDASGHISVDYLPPASRSIVIGPEDYIGAATVGQSQFFPLVTGAGGSVTATADVGGHPGNLSLVMGTTSNTGYAASWTGAWTRVGYAALTWEAVAGPVSLGAAGADYNIFAGMIDTATAAPGNGAYFKYNYNVNGGRWECISNNGGSTTVVDSGVALTGGVFQKLTIAADALGTSIKYYIDGVLVATITTNLYSGSANVGFGVSIHKTATGGTTSRTFLVDMQVMSQSLSNSR